MGATILGNNPAGHSFVLRDLVLIELSGHAPPPTSLEEWRGVKNFRKTFVGEGGGRNFNFGGGVILLGDNFYKIHLLSSDKIFFSMAIWRKCLEHSVVFPVNLF